MADGKEQISVKSSRANSWTESKYETSFSYYQKNFRYYFNLVDLKITSKFFLFSIEKGQIKAIYI